MSAIRYLLDENVNSLFRVELLKRESKLLVWKDRGVRYILRSGGQ